jgi:oligoendopeptidase F
LANLIFQHFKARAEMAKARNYDSVIESLIHNDKVEVKMLEALYGSVQNNLSPIKKYANAYKKFYKIKFGNNPKA